MSIVKPSSAVSEVCDCPYSCTSDEVKFSEESDKKRKNMLKAELRKTNEEVNIARCTLIDTRRKVAAIRRILRMELGCEINPYVTAQSTWRDRVQEENYLKSELVHLVDHLRDCDPLLYRTDLAVNLTELSTSTEDLLLAAQEKALKKLYHGYTVYHTENEKLSGTCLRDFFRMKKNYEGKLYHNKILEQEIVFIKNKISNLQQQFLEDKCLIDYIANHHFNIKGCFAEVSPEKNDSHHEKQEEILDPETVKYKKLWEKSKSEKKKMFSSIEKLDNDLEMTKERIIRAENICAKNILSLHQLAMKIKENISLAKLQPKKEGSFGKFSLIQYRSQKSQLEAAIGENTFLRKFLRKAVLSREGDLKYYQQSLQSTADKYQKVLEDIRSSLMQTPSQKPAK